MHSILKTPAWYVAMLVFADNFLTNAEPCAAFVRTLNFSVRGNYPGRRTRGYASSAWIPLLEKLVGEKITYFDTSQWTYNGAFQVCTAADGDSWIHADATDWAAVLFLTPNAPIDAGLTLYRHARTGLLGSDGRRDALVALSDARTPGAWDVAATVGNVFNRLVLFRGTQFHKSSRYFGTSASDARVFQVLFFNTTSPPLVPFRVTEPRVRVLVFSTNRYEYLGQTLASVRDRVDFSGCGAVDLVLVDDYPAARDDARTAALVAEYGMRHVRHDVNMGLGASWREQWLDLAKTKDVDWVLHLEEDAVFDRRVRVTDVARAFTSNLAQIFFKRNVCYPRNDFIADIENGRLGDDHAGSVGVVQSRYFVAMASLYPAGLCARYDYALDPHEHNLRDFFFRNGWSLTSGMWGARGDPPVVRHIGEISRGVKVSVGDPDHARFARLPTDADYHFETGERVDERVITPPSAHAAA